MLNPLLLNPKSYKKRKNRYPCTCSIKSLIMPDYEPPRRTMHSSLLLSRGTCVGAELGIRYVWWGFRKWHILPLRVVNESSLEALNHLLWWEEGCCNADYDSILLLWAFPISKPTLPRALSSREREHVNCFSRASTQKCYVLPPLICSWLKQFTRSDPISKEQVNALWPCAQRKGTGISTCSQDYQTCLHISEGLWESNELGQESVF